MQDDITNTFTSPINTNIIAPSKRSWIMMLGEEAEKKFSGFRNSFSRSGNINSPKFKLPKLTLFLLLLLAIVGGIIFFASSNRTQSTQATASNEPKPAAPSAKFTKVVNQAFDFPIKDSAGKEISKIRYLVESASLQDEILVKGERARAVQGRTFFILNLKITNNYKQGIQINSKDYIRLVVDGKKTELTAADIHNDPVEVQAISTKSTRLGFPISEDYKTLELQVGEINGSKESIQINFR